jgi:hypothetical protein
MKVGDVFGRLTVVELIPHNKSPKALCRCECGRQSTPHRSSLLSGKAKSCGCLSKEMTVARTKSHGQSKAPEYLIYMGMVTRCENPTSKHFARYGARGIRVEYEDFAAFFADVGPRPAGAWIDRVDNDASYRPGNCRWVTPDKSQTNKRNSKIWTIHGVDFESCAEAAAVLGIGASTVIRRCNAGTPGWSCRLKYPGRGAA